MSHHYVYLKLRDRFTRETRGKARDLEQKGKSMFAAPLTFNFAWYATHYPFFATFYSVIEENFQL